MTSNQGGDEPLIFTYLFLLFGSFLIARFLLSEYALGKRKHDNSRGTLNFTWHDQFHYRLDYYLSQSQWAKPILLFAGTFLLVVCGSIALTLATGIPIYASCWISWTYVADPGTHADAEGTINRLVSFIISIGGMLIFALMIGIISEVLGERVDMLKQGKARVIESNHTLLLGWTDKSLGIIQQISLANKSDGGGVIVVLADKEKAEMEENLNSALEAKERPLSLFGTQVIFRSGDPLSEINLRKVSLPTARAAICLSANNCDPDEADSQMVRQVLALEAFGGVREHAVVEMQDADNTDLVKLVSPQYVEVVVAHDMIGRLMIQCARQPGLAHVIESLMGFVGDEFYFAEWPDLVGKTFLEITCRFDAAIPVGIKYEKGKIELNPDNSYVIKKGDKVLCLAEDIDTYSVNDRFRSDAFFSSAFSKRKKKIKFTSTVSQLEREKEKLLFCGWRRDMADMIVQLDAYVPPGSEVWLINPVPPAERLDMFRDKGMKGELKTKNLFIKNVVGSPIVRRDLLKLTALDNNGISTGEEATLDEFDSILILASDVKMQVSDSNSLSSLLIIQDIQVKLIEERKKQLEISVETEEKNKRPCEPISEILDSRTQKLFSVARCKGYIMSNQIISAAISQIAQDRDMNAVLGELLQAEGSELYIRSVSEYLDLHTNKRQETYQSFWFVALRARQKNEICLGYKPRDMTFSEASEFLLNPPDKAVKRHWIEGDSVVVLAMD